ALRTKESGGPGRKTETSFLTVHDDASRISLARQRISESYVIVTDTERHVYFPAFTVGKGTSQLIGAIMYAGCLNTRLDINFVNLFFLMPRQFHLSCKISRIGNQPQRRRFNQLFPIIREGIRRFTSFRTCDRYLQLSVRTAYNHILC